MSRPAECRGAIHEGECTPHGHALSGTEEYRILVRCSRWAALRREQVASSVSVRSVLSLYNGGRRVKSAIITEKYGPWAQQGLKSTMAMAARVSSKFSRHTDMSARSFS